MGEYTLKYCGSVDVDSEFIKTNKELVKLSESIKKLILCCKNEFIPPLDYRIGSIGSSSVQNSEQVGINIYLKTILAQKNIVVLTQDEGVIAFMSFKYNYENREYLSPVAQASDVINYVTTIIVDPTHRRKGLTSRMYECIESDLPNSVQSTCVATRTWHTNYSHINLLIKRGYCLTHTFHKERTFKDKFYDTTYYCKRIKDVNEC